MDATITFDTADQATYLATMPQLVGNGHQVQVDGQTATFDTAALNVLADLSDYTDGYFDGLRVWVDGNGYRVVRKTGRTPIGPEVKTRLTKDEIEELSRRSQRLGIDRSELIRYYVRAGIATRTHYEHDAVNDLARDGYPKPWIEAAMMALKAVGLEAPQPCDVDNDIPLVYTDGEVNRLRDQLAERKAADDARIPKYTVDDIGDLLNKIELAADRDDVALIMTLDSDADPVIGVVTALGDVDERHVVLITAGNVETIVEQVGDDPHAIVDYLNGDRDYSVRAALRDLLA